MTTMVRMKARQQGKSLQIFQFLRGAVRSAYGIEDFRGKTILIVGMAREGQELLNRLCLDGVVVKFQDPSVKNYSRSFAICQNVDIYEGENVDIIVDLANNHIWLKDRTFPIGKIKKNDAYNQGIGEFYL